MTKQEFAILAEALAKAYKKNDFMSDVSEQKVWYELLKDIPYQAMSVAVYKWISTQKWNPSIAELREMAAGIITEPIPGCEEAWEKVLRIARDFSPYDFERTQEQINRLDNITKECLKLVDVKSIAYTENLAVDRAHFMKTYEALSKRLRQDRQTPASVKQAIESMQPERVIEDKQVRTGLPIFTDSSKQDTDFDRMLRDRFLAQA